MRFELKAYCVSTVFTSSTTFGGPPSPKGKVWGRVGIASPINCNLKIFRSSFPLKKGAFTVEDSLVGIDMDQETSEMEEISMASPVRAAVKKSKRMTLS